MNKNQKKTNPYTCETYREEMKLLGLKLRLNQQGLTPEERTRILNEIEELEKILGMD